MERNNQLLKKLDFWFGIPLLYCLSLFRLKKRKLPKSIKTVGVFAFAAIGDSILSSGLFKKIQNRFPGVKIIVFASPSNASIYSLLGGYDHLVILPISKPWKAMCILRQFPLDLLVDTSQWSRISAILSLLSRSSYSIGFETLGQFRHVAYDEKISHRSDCHELHNFEHLMDPLEIEGQITPMLNKSSIERVDSRKLESINKPYIVFHPWASGTFWQMREWPAEYWVELAGNLISKGFCIAISGSESNVKGADELAALIGGGNSVHVFAGKLSLQETALLLSAARAVVSVNTGIAHLADHLMVPTIALNGPTNSKRWGVIGEKSKNIDVARLDGGGFLSLGFEYPKNPKYIMNQISVQQVESALRDIAL